MMIIILFCLLCLLMTIDTGLFVYPSLSRMLLMMVAVLSLTIISASFSLVKREKVNLTFPVVFVISWLVYTLSHGWYVGETYRTLYLSACLIGIITFANLIRTGLLSEQHLSYGLIGIAIVHIIYMAMQYLGLVASGNAFFRITGSNENPTTTALSLTGIIPFLVARMRERKNPVFHIILLIIFLLGIFSLRCRTAYIGVIVIFCYYAITNQYVQTHVFSLLKRHIFLSAAVIIVVSATSVYKMYTMKQDSADGRLLVWKLSAEMIEDNPLGYGYGMFEKYYNLKQSDYFDAFGGTRQERDNATHISMAYNDYLEHGIEGGVVGAIFLIGFYVLFAMLSFRHKLRDVTPVLISFSVMSLMNFVIQGIQSWGIVCICSGLILSRDIFNPKYTVVRFKGFIPHLIIIVVSAAIMIKTFSLISSQYTLSHNVSKMKDNKTVSDNEFAEAEKNISTSEAFWFYRAKNSIRHGNYPKAEIYLKNALQFSSSPDKFFLMYRICLKQKLEYKGIKYLSYVSNMNPCHLYPKLLLMRYYDNHSDTGTARLYANDILNTKVKNPSTKSQFIQYEAYQYLCNH